MSSDSMNIELMQVVERAVRPVRAAGRRKLKMRQELYAHLEEIYLERVQSGCSPDEARAEAVRRFGPPSEIRDELQRSVPRLERWGSQADRVFSRRSQERPAAFALRIGPAAGAAYALWIALSLLLVSLLQGRPLSDFIPGYMALQAAVFAVNFTAMVWIGTHVTDRLLSRPRHDRSSVFALVLGTFGAASVAAGSLMLLVAWSQIGTPNLVPALVSAGASATVATVLLFPLICELYVSEQRRFRPWTSLTLA